MLSFSHIWIFALLPLPWLLRRVLPPLQPTRIGVRVPFGSRIIAATGDGSSTAKAVRTTRHHFVPALVWLLLLTALARPQWLEPPLTKELSTRDLLLLVDLSGSMRQEDFTNNAGETTDRLTAVKEVLGDFLTRREGDRVGLVVFGDAPFLQAPFSTDLELSRQLLDESQVGMAGPRTAFGDAIGLGVNLFDQSDAPAKTIIALTDGNDTKSQVPPVEAARVAKQRGIRIHTVAIGDPTTVGEDKLDETTLREVSKAADGSYFFTSDREGLAGIYNELDRIETRQVKVISHRPRRDIYFWPLLVALLLSVAEKTIAMLRKEHAFSSEKAARNIRVHPLTGKLEITS